MMESHWLSRSSKLALAFCLGPPICPDCFSEIGVSVGNRCKRNDWALILSLFCWFGHFSVLWNSDQILNWSVAKAGCRYSLCWCLAREAMGSVSGFLRLSSFFLISNSSGLSFNNTHWFFSLSTKSYSSAIWFDYPRLSPQPCCGFSIWWFPNYILIDLT